jgi:chromosome segregation ATPase
MTTNKHISAINAAFAKIASARGELETVQRLGEQTLSEMDTLNSSENPDESEVQILESRLRGLTARKTAAKQSLADAEAELASAVDAAIAALDSLAQQVPGFDEAANTILPWCKGSIETARRAALRLPAFQETAAQIGFLRVRHAKTDPDEIAPALLKFLAELSAASPTAPVTA